MTVTRVHVPDCGEGERWVEQVVHAPKLGLRSGAPLDRGYEYDVSLQSRPSSAHGRLPSRYMYSIHLKHTSCTCLLYDRLLHSPFLTSHPASSS